MKISNYNFQPNSPVFIGLGIGLKSVLQKTNFIPDSNLSGFYMITNSGYTVAYHDNKKHNKVDSGILVRN